jgi:hypothetical protein
VGENVIGRERELAVLTRFLDGAREAPAAMLLEGEAGIGKSILWRHVLGQPGPDRLVLVSHPTASDADLPFAVLNDLMDPVLDEALPVLADLARIASMAERLGNRDDTVSLTVLRDPKIGREKR